MRSSYILFFSDSMMTCINKNLVFFFSFLLKVHNTNTSKGDIQQVGAQQRLHGYFGINWAATKQFPNTTNASMQQAHLKYKPLNPKIQLWLIGHKITTVMQLLVITNDMRFDPMIYIDIIARIPDLNSLYLEF